MVRIIVAGTRTFFNYRLTKEVLDELINKLGQSLEIVSGGAKGADYMGEKYASEHDIPVKRFDADWSIGKRAGIIRNELMGNYADGAICFWDQKSRGTLHMINYMKKLNKPVLIINYLKQREKA